MKKSFNLVLSLIILVSVCLSSTSCLFNFKMYYDYDWISDSPAMQLNFTGSADDVKTLVGTMTWENVEYRFHLTHDYSTTVYAETFDLETYEYVPLFEATAEQNKDTLYLEINSSSLPSLVGEVITLTKTELPDTLRGYRFRSADSSFYIDFSNKRGNSLQFQDKTYPIYADHFKSGEYILFYEFSEDFVYSLENRKDEGLLFVVTPKLEGDVLTLTVIRSIIDNLLGQTFILTKISE